MRDDRRRTTGLPLLALGAALLACTALFPPRPTLEWDTAPESLVAQAHTGGGMEYLPNDTYDARLWGDGRLVWTEYASDGSRQLYTALLPPEAMRPLLQQFVDAGFFGWAEHYSPGEVFDAPSSCLSVHLAAASHSVCETLEGAPDRFHELYRLIASGAEQPPTVYAPAEGYLLLTPIGPDIAAGSQAPIAWPAQSLGLSLAEVAAGAGSAWLEGEALAFAWSAVNTNHYHPVFTEGEQAYGVQLLVAGVTVEGPPER
jgi:hypothetical protein